MTDRPATPPQASPDELVRRVEELERRLGQTESERDQFRSAAYDLADQLVPADPDWQPPPAGEQVDARQLLTDLERRHGVRRS